MWRPGEAALGYSQLCTMTDTAAVDTAPVDNELMDTAVVESAVVDTAVMDTAVVETAVVDTADDIELDSKEDKFYGRYVIIIGNIFSNAKI